MISLRNVFLLASVCSFGNTYCSQEHLPEERKIIINSTDSHNNASTTAPTQSDDIPKLIPMPQPSTAATDAWYTVFGLFGLQKQTKFKELNKTGRLQADFDANPGKAINCLNDSITERYTCDLMTAKEQNRIYNLITNAQKISKNFVIGKAIAIKNLQPQQEAMNAILKKQALETEPNLRKKRRDAIKAAKLEYIDGLLKELKHAQEAAYNCQYLNDNAQDEFEFEYEKPDHYTGLKEYSALLESIQKENNVPTISESNAADEQAYTKYAVSYNAADLE